MLYERPGCLGCAVDEPAALIDMIEKGNVAGAVGAEPSLKHDRGGLMVETPSEKLTVDFLTLFAESE
jgi:hypothetical protein